MELQPQSAAQTGLPGQLAIIALAALIGVAIGASLVPRTDAGVATGNAQPATNGSSLLERVKPEWFDDGSAAGYYGDQWGNISRDGGQRWSPSYLPPSFAPDPGLPLPLDPFGHDAPYVTPQTAPGEYGTNPYLLPQPERRGDG